MRTLYEKVTMYDGERLQAARFESDTSVKTKGIIQIIHGFGEHIGMYIELASFFTAKGYCCVTHDQRGFGKMPEKTKAQVNLSRGVVPGYSYFLQDADTIRKAIKEWYPGIPIILYGHSMGGNIAINILRTQPNAYKKAILEAPWLRLYKPPNRQTRFLAKRLGSINHKLAITSKINIYDITRDLETVNKIMRDRHYHNRISLKLFTQITSAGERILKEEVKINTPTLLLCAGNDKIVCPEAIRTFARQAGENVLLKDYPEGYHALRSDIIKNDVLNDMLLFLSGAGSVLKFRT